MLCRKRNVPFPHDSSNYDDFFVSALLLWDTVSFCLMKAGILNNWI